MLRPAKTEETVTYRQNNVKEVGTLPVRSNSCISLTAISTVVQSKVVKTISVKQHLNIVQFSMTAQLYPPPLDIALALQGPRQGLGLYVVW